MNSRSLILAGISLLFCLKSYSQCGNAPPGLTFVNPSFEGPSCAGCQPGPWVDCGGTPDTQPGQWAFTAPASHGSSYVSFLQSGWSATGYYEGSSQQLSACMVAGEVYSFSIDLAHSNVYATAEPGDCQSSLEIWGTNTLCGESELLWQSGLITNTAWQTYNVILTPTSNWCYVSFRPYFITPCSGYMNISVDNLGPLQPVVPTLHSTVNADIGCSQTVVGTIECPADSIVLSGAFFNSPEASTLLTDSTWELNVSYPFGSAGSQTIYVEAFLTSGGSLYDTLVFDLIEIYPDISAPGVCEGTTTQLADSSVITSGSLVSWTWNFGDGSPTSSLQHPTHDFDTAGSYYVTLSTVSDLGCTNTYSEYIIVDPNPVADFSVDDVCIFEDSYFHDLSIVSSGNIVEWDWDFGDGGIDSVQNPIYAYAAPGTYNAILTVETDSGCVSTATYPALVSELPVADFTFVSGCSDTVTFSDASTVAGGTIATWNWEFGDFIFSSLEDPFHVYSSAGSFITTLIAGSDAGCLDTITKQVNVDAVPYAFFTAPGVCLDDSSYFTDLSVVAYGDIISWDWDFGDFNTGTLQNPAHLYLAPATYTVILTIESDSGCTDVFSRDIEVYENPVADFTAQDACAESPMFFANNSSITSGSIDLWHWDFGDFDLIPAIPNSTSMVSDPVFTYYNYGTFDVELIATSDHGCKDTIELPVIVNPIPEVFFTTANVCYGEDAVFTDATILNGDVISGWDWDFGDTQGSALQNPTHNYANSGFYPVTLEVTTGNNCTGSYSDNIRVHPSPVADFVAPEVCAGTPSSFTDQSTISLGDIIRFEWDFDDLNTSGLQDPQNLYALPGSYDVQLVVTSDSACTDTVVNTIDVNAYPVVDFSSDILDGCVQLPVRFTDLSTIDAPESITDYLWEFSDGGSSVDQNTIHVFGTDGVFSVSLTAISADGCVTTKDSIDMITVYPKPSAAFTYGPQPTTVFDRRIRFTDLSTGAISWDWDFGDVALSAEQHPEHLYPDSGHYLVEQIVTNQYGCKDTVEHLIVIDGAFALYVPNAFTPGANDVLNETFSPKGFGFTTYSFRIYNRWGQQVFSTFIYGEGWDGTLWNAGQELPNDVYVYTVEVTDFANERHKYTGHVTLMR